VHWEDLFEAISESHEGLVAKFHLRDVGLDSTHWWRAIRTGRWPMVSRRVVRSAAAPMTPTQRVLAAVLDASPGAALHHRSALAWVGMRGYSLARLEVARGRSLSGCATELADLHELRWLRAHDVMVVRGVVTETALRAIWSEAAEYAAPARLEYGALKIGGLLDRANRMGLVTWAGLHEMVDDLQQRGRAGTVLMRRLAEARPPGSSVTESGNEDRFEKVLADSGVRRFRRQQVVGGHEPIGRCDFSDEQLPLAVEVNSLTFHTTPTDRAADERRYQALMDAGFTVCVIWEDDLWSHPSEVIETIVDARRRASEHQRVVLHSPTCPWPEPRVGAPT
jgi:very-short-patch-repair endonuclease